LSDQRVGSATKQSRGARDERGPAAADEFDERAEHREHQEENEESGLHIHMTGSRRAFFRRIAA